MNTPAVRAALHEARGRLNALTLQLEVAKLDDSLATATAQAIEAARDEARTLARAIEAIHDALELP